VLEFGEMFHHLDWVQVGPCILRARPPGKGPKVVHGGFGIDIDGSPPQLELRVPSPFPSPSLLLFSFFFSLA
jgi:hypothetical protein